MIDITKVQVDLDTAHFPRAVVEGANVNAQVPTAEVATFNVAVQQGEMLKVTQLYLKITRITVAAPVGAVRAGVRVQTQGRVTRTVAEVELMTNAIGDNQVQSLPCNMQLFPNDVISGYYSDASTGGTVDFVCAMVGVASDLRQAS